jgi:hypothetical protein
MVWRMLASIERVTAGRMAIGTDQQDIPDPSPELTLSISLRGCRHDQPKERTMKQPVNCQEIARDLITLANELLEDKLTQGEFYQDLTQLTEQVEAWAAETPSAYR